MSDIQDTINSIVQGLYKAKIIDKKTLKNFVADDVSVNQYTAEEIQQIRKKQNLSQAVFAKYLNISPATVRSLEQGQRHAHGAILKLINIVDRHGVNFLN